jgi:dethiobiotin synthetase
MGSGLFVAGTDTGVGKTLVACALLRILRARGVDAVAFKPVATGEEGGALADVEALWQASEGAEPRERICPVRYRAALAPVPAAEREKREPSLAPAREALRKLAARHPVIVAEGIGGLLVPLDRQTLLVDFMCEAAFPVVLVARAGLGTINHTLLSLRELDRAGLNLAALVMNVTRAEDTASARESVREIERHAAHGCLAVVLPHLGQEDEEVPFAARVARAAASLTLQLDVPGLFQ